MAEDLIDRYVDRSAIESDTQFMKDNLNEVAALVVKMKELMKTGIGSPDSTSLKGVRTAATEYNTIINDMEKAKQKLAQILAEIQKAESKLKDALITNAQGHAELNKQIQQLSPTIQENIRLQLQYKTRLEEISGKLFKLREEQKLLNGLGGNEQAKKEIDDRVQALAQEEAQIKILNQELIRFTKNQIKEFQSAEGSTNNLRAQLNQLLQLFDSLSPEDKISESGKEMKKRIDEVTEAVTKEEQSTNRFQRNVGNYANSLASGFQKISDEITKIKQRNDELKSNFQNLTGGRIEIEGFHKGLPGASPQTNAQLKSITDEIKRNDQALAQLNHTQEIGFKTGQSYQQVIRQLENDYKGMVASGTVSEEFLKQFAQFVANASHQSKELSKDIRAIGSETRALDLVAGAMNTVVSGFQAAAGASALFGDNNDNVQKTIQKLIAIESIANGIREIGKQVTEKTTLAGKAYNFVLEQGRVLFGKGTTAAERFGAALKGIVVLALIGGLIELVQRLTDTSDSAAGAQKALEKFNDELERNKKIVADLNESDEFDFHQQLELIKQQFAEKKKNVKDEIELVKVNNEEKKALFLEEVKFREQQNTRLSQQHQEALKELEAERKVRREIKKELEGTPVDLTSDQKKVLNERLKIAEQNVKDIEAAQKKGFRELTLLRKKQNTDDLNQDAEAARKAREKANEEAKKKLDEAEKIAERNRQAQFEIKKRELEGIIEIGEDISKNEKVNQQSRLNALQVVTLKRIELIELEAAFETGKAKTTAIEVANIEDKKQKEINRILRDSQDTYNDIIKNQTKKEIELRESAAEVIKDAIERALKEKQDKLREDLTKEQDIVNQKKALYKELGDSIKNLGFGLISASLERQKNALQEQIDLLEQKKQKEIEAVNATISNEQDKASQIAIIEARANAQKEIIQQKQRQLDIKKAQADKAKSIIDIIENTAVGVTNAIAASPLTLGQPFVSLIAAIGAAQLALAIAQPIPKYKHGKNVKDLYEGPAIVGDGGKREMIVREDGRLQITDKKPQLTFVKAKDIILPDADSLIAGLNQRSERRLNELSKYAHYSEPDNTGKYILAELKNVTKAINRIPQPVIEVENVIRKKIRQGGGDSLKHVA